MACQSGGGGHRRADQMGSTTGALAAFEVAVAGRCATLAGLETVGVHRQTHAAAWLAPLETGSLEDLVQPFGFGLHFDQTRPRHHHRELDAARDPTADAADHRRSLAHVLDPAVGARADEDLVDADVGDGLVGLQAHVDQRALDRVTLGVVALLVGVWHALVDGQHHLGAGAPGDLGLELGRVDLDHQVEMRAIVAAQATPQRCGMLELDALGRERPALDIADRGLVNSHQPGPGAGLDRHVAHRHPAFHAQRTDRRAAELDRVTGAACGANLADDRQHDVLGAHAPGQHAVDLDQQVFRLLGQQRLGGHHMLDLAGADAMGQCAKSAVRAGVAVAADHRHARQRRALLRPDHMDDALAPVEKRKVGCRAKSRDVGVQRGDLQLADRVLDAVVTQRPVGGRGVVVSGGNDGADAPDLAPGQTQTLVGLRAGHLVHQVAVDVERGSAIVLGVDDMVVPELVVEGACGHGVLLLSRRRGRRSQRPVRFWPGLSRHPARTASRVARRGCWRCGRAADAASTLVSPIAQNPVCHVIARSAHPLDQSPARARPADRLRRAVLHAGADQHQPPGRAAWRASDLRRWQVPQRRVAQATGRVGQDRAGAERPQGPVVGRTRPVLGPVHRTGPATRRASPMVGGLAQAVSIRQHLAPGAVWRRRAGRRAAGGDLRRRHASGIRPSVQPEQQRHADPGQHAGGGAAASLRRSAVGGHRPRSALPPAAQSASARGPRHRGGASTAVAMAAGPEPAESGGLAGAAAPALGRVAGAVRPGRRSAPRAAGAGPPRGPGAARGQRDHRRPLRRRRAGLRPGLEGTVGAAGQAQAAFWRSQQLALPAGADRPVRPGKVDPGPQVRRRRGRPTRCRPLHLLGHLAGGDRPAPGRRATQPAQLHARAERQQRGQPAAAQPPAAGGLAGPQAGASNSADGPWPGAGRPLRGLRPSLAGDGDASLHRVAARPSAPARRRGPALSDRRAGRPLARSARCDRRARGLRQCGNRRCRGRSPDLDGADQRTGPGSQDRAARAKSRCPRSGQTQAGFAGQPDQARRLARTRRGGAACGQEAALRQPAGDRPGASRSGPGAPSSGRLVRCAAAADRGQRGPAGDRGADARRVPAVPGRRPDPP